MNHTNASKHAQPARTPRGNHHNKAAASQLNMTVPHRGKHGLQAPQVHNVREDKAELSRKVRANARQTEGEMTQTTDGRGVEPASNAVSTVWV